MKHLHCTVCKFTLPVNPEEAKVYKANLPMHCGQAMVVDGGSAPAPEPKEEAAPKEEKKGLFGLGGKKKKK